MQFAKNHLSLVYDNRFNLSDNHFCSFIYKREIAENVRFREDLSICEDVDFLFRALIECKNIMIVDTIIFAYRMNDCSVTHSKKHKYDTKQILERNLKAWVSLYYEFENNLINEEDIPARCCKKNIKYFVEKYISDSIVYNKSYEKMLSELSRFISIDTLLKISSESDSEAIKAFIDMSEDYYSVYRNKSFLRIVAIKLHINNIKFLRKIFLPSSGYETISKWIV